MRVNFCNTKEQKKRMISIVSEVTGAKAEYLGPPQFTYKIGAYMVDKTGTLITDFADDEQTAVILEKLEEAGIVGERDEGQSSRAFASAIPETR